MLKLLIAFARRAAVAGSAFRAMNRGVAPNLASDLAFPLLSCAQRTVALTAYRKERFPVIQSHFRSVQARESVHLGGGI
jgi:hypothetical protein